MTDRAPITEHTLANAVKVNRGWRYQPPGGGPSKVLVSAEELDELHVTQDRWIAEERKKLGMKTTYSGRNTDV